MIRIRGCKWGPVLGRWERLIREGVISENGAQLRAVGKVDEIFQVLKTHQSTVGISVELGIKSVEKLHSDIFDEDQHRVEQYTRNLAEANKRLLALQKGSGAKFEEKIHRVTVGARTKIQKYSLPEKQERAEPDEAVRNGVYLFGSVGRGKTMLMDILYSELKQTKGTRIERLHFYDFMNKVHSRMHQNSGIEKIGNEMCDALDILCLDEVSVSDVQDASVFPSILEVFSKRKVSLVLTSNQHPQDLYMNGLNRHIYLPPLLRELRRNVVVLSLNDDEENIDFRKKKEKLNWKFSRRIPASILKDYSKRIHLSPTRSVSLPFDSERAALVCSIEALTEQDLSEADYITLSQYLLDNRLRIEVIIGKKFSPADILGSARRFVKLIEILYDKNVSVVMICSEFKPTSVFDEIYRVEKLIETGSIGAGPHSLASPLSLPAVSEAILSIARCRSRLEQCVASDIY